MDIRDERTRRHVTSCRYHKDEVYTMYCVTCQCLVCTSCFLENHYNQHKLCKVDEVLKRKHAEFCKMLTTNIKRTDETVPAVDKRGNQCEDPSDSKQHQGQKWLKKMMLEKLERMVSEKQELSNLTETLSKKIDDRTDFLIQNLESERTRLLSTVENAKKTHIYSRSIEKEDIELCISYLNIYEKDLKIVDELDNVFLLRITEMLISALEKVGVKDQLDVATFLTYTFQDDTDITGIMKTLVGDVNFHLREIDYCGKKSQCPKIDTGKRYVEDARKRTIQLKYHSIIKKILPVDDRIVYVIADSVTDIYRAGVYGGQNTLCKYDLEECTDISSNYPVKKNTADICAGPKQCVYFCSLESSVISRYTRDNRLLHFVDCGPDNYPRCLHFVKENQILVGIQMSDEMRSKNCAYPKTYNMDVAVFNTMGQCLNITHCGSSDRGYMRYPYRIVNSKTSPLLLLTHWGGKNSLGNITNAVTRSIIFQGAIGLQPAKTFHPTGICVDNQGRILVSDYNNHLVYLLHPDGKFNKILLSEEDGVVHPSSLAMDEKGQLWIACKNIINIVKYRPDS